MNVAGGQIKRTPTAVVILLTAITIIAPSLRQIKRRRPCKQALPLRIAICLRAHYAFITLFFNIPTSLRVTALVYYVSTRTAARYVSSSFLKAGSTYLELIIIIYPIPSAPGTSPSFPRRVSHDSILLGVDTAVNKVSRKLHHRHRDSFFIREENFAARIVADNFPTEEYTDIPR